MSVTAMIAPDASIGKSEWKLPPAGSRDRDIVSGDHHGFVNGIIILPNSGQARMRVGTLLPQGPVLPWSAGFFSPPAPRSSGRIGPAQCEYAFRVRFNPNDFRAGPSRPF